MPNIGINGFCRIGRVVLRTCLENDEVQVTAINDPAVDIEYMCYLIKFDSTHGKLKNGEIIMKRHQGEIKINDTTIKIFHEKKPTKIPWHLANVHYVIEASGMFTTLEKASGHLTNNSVKRVIVTAPSVNIPMLILGVNEHKINSDHRVISATSSTLYCLAPIVKVLEDNFGVSEGFLTSIHAMTSSLKPLDGLCLRGKYWRDHRSIHQNIIPASTGACRALAKIIPSVKDKLSGTAFRVPIVNVSVLDLTIRLNTPTSIADILQVIEKTGTERMKNIIRVSNEEAVSSDFMDDSHSCIVDAESSIQLRPNFFKIICWYENEYSYACRVIDSILFTENLANPCLELNSKVSAVTVLARVPEEKESEYPPEEKTATIKSYENGDTSSFQENGTKSKIPTRIPKRVKGKNDSSVIEPVSTKSDVPGISVNPEHESREIADNIDQGDIPKRKCTYSVSQNTFMRTLSTVKIFQAQQERLDKVKQEFDKVASFTEDLLNKTKMFNDKLLSLSDESINESNKQTAQNEAASNITYVKYDDAGDDKVLIMSSECSEEIKNWNLEELKGSSPSQNSNEIQNEEESNAITKNEDRTATSNVEKNVLLTDLMKRNEVNDSESQNFRVTNENENKTGKEIKENTKFDCNLGDTTSADSSYNNIMQEIEDEIKCTTGHGQVFETRNHVVKYDRYLNIPPQIIENSKEDLVDSLMDIPSASKMSITAEVLNSKMGIAKDLSDLYDKLDSVSNTASEGSFREKKSEIIKFSDLSHSMDELEKLDQFCKLIEISDEISDHLFSNLSNGETTPKREWSFGDFCKKMNLDEFCKKMFKKPELKPDKN